ncbi:fatty acid desaturase family protein [Streptomyces sp. NPDC048392]|uniref:fatty acid desaturase family protein n=1 Tax=Streptomyces sp. NPDC048392 TaxID=3365543 RepID=UPI0037122604
MTDADVAAQPPAAPSVGRRGGGAAAPYRRGYTSPRGLRDQLAAAHRTKLWRTVCAALADHTVAGGLALLVAWLWVRAAPLWGMSLALPASMVIARHLRGLENLVHEGSHYNWTRHHRRTNDILAFSMAALPTGQRLRNYRDSHLLHHGQFGTDADPDLRRYRELGIEGISRESLLGFASQVAVLLLRYQRGWLRELRMDIGAISAPVIWSIVAVGCPATLWLGPTGGVVAAGAWLTSMLVILPVIRFIAEADEHSYSDSSTVFDATITNTGWVQRFLFHPHGDGYHTVHHMWPGIPHHTLVRIHRLLMAEDEKFASRIRTRTRVLSGPRPLQAVT